MKYFIFKITHRSDSTGFTHAWYLTKPHESIRDYEKVPPSMTQTYEGFETFDAARNWIDQNGEKSMEYTILPIIKRS